MNENPVVIVASVGWLRRRGQHVELLIEAFRDPINAISMRKKGGSLRQHHTMAAAAFAVSNPSGGPLPNIVGLRVQFFAAKMTERS